MKTNLLHLPQIESSKSNALIKYLNELCEYDFLVEHYNVSGDKAQDIVGPIETKYSPYAVLKIVNSRWISIEYPERLERPQLEQLTEWLERNQLVEHVIAISQNFDDINLVRPFCNLLQLEIFDPINDPEQLEPIELPYLINLYLELPTEAILLFLGKSLQTIESLELDEVNTQLNHVSTSLLNNFYNLVNLTLVNPTSIQNVEELSLQKLTALSLRQTIQLDQLVGCPNLTYLTANINTNTPQSKGPSLEVLNLVKGSVKEVNLNNLDTTKLKTLSVHSDVDVVIDSLIPSLRDYIDRSSLEESKKYKLSTLELLPNLEHLAIRMREIEFDLPSNWQSNKLRSLSLVSCNLDNISFIKHFPMLSHLSAPGNRIGNIEPLKRHAVIDYLVLSSNNILDIPAEIAEKYRLLTHGSPHIPGDEESSSIILSGNPLISPPIEILERGDDAVKPYFDSMVGDTKELNEAKIVFLGNGEVGKTSLMKALSDECFDAQEATTHGINIKKYTVPINEKYSIDASIWDFGGQQIMHATHQLFLSRRCVYVLVINDRKDDLQQEQKINYWLQQVQTFGGSSKVIIIRNKSDMFTLNNVPEGRLKEKYPNLVAIESVSCKTGDNIQRVKNLINEQVRQLPMRKVRLARNWIQIKEDIKDLSLEYDHLPLSRFSDICNSYGVTDYEAQKTLRNLLHDLSVIIAFEELDGFDMGILNPHWITDGIYTLINSDILEQKKGYIKLPDAQTELDRAHPGKYVNKARFIVESMIQFELCHPVGNASNGTYLVPNLLPNEIKSKRIKSGLNTIRFVFKYDNLLPPSIIPSLLVRMNSQIPDDKRWRTGAIMTDTKLDVQARVEEDSVERELKILVSGTQARDFFSVIRHEIRNLNEPNTKALGVRELVPLNTQSTEFVDYEELIGLEVMGKPTYTSGRLQEEFSVTQLLSGIESREETENSVARQREDISVNVEVNQGDINIKTGDNVNTNTASSEQSQVVTQSQQIDIKIELKSLKGTCDYVLDDLISDADYEIVNEVDRAKFIRECDRVKNAISEIEQIDTKEEAESKPGHFMRVRDFLNNALDNVGPVGEAVEALGSNITKVRELAKKYNTVAGYFGLPIVPEVLL
ncbi:ADP-ribosylation factor-like protein [Vibrio diabolicus]|nr:ADP-ribosylation factor-like protein [Vibrio diabolicus]